MIEIRLKDGQTGYSAVAEYVRRYWNRNTIEDVIVSVGTSYDGENYYRYIDIASPADYSDVEFLHDWWEGEKYIKIFGIKALGLIDIAGGLYE